ncbi:DUF4145 domain-containing protein [Candidatus Magnetomonas plexicatena]|uniref:DUF4145 domain-containing protein n=1 Tax=Candidatus Magnetomonas plexicatena TaxID=2552947 RepID=UPI001C768080|nr:DUF4145 domain-containing protein [Nitrospirales bacterium LBB_01]
MILPKQLNEKFNKRFDELIEEGNKLLSNVQIIEYKNDHLNYGKQIPIVGLNKSEFIEWRTDCHIFLTQLFPEGHVHKEYADNFRRLSNEVSSVERCVAIIKSLKYNLEQGYLSDLSSQIEAEIAADYMTHAERLIEEGAGRKYNHVPAAVLAGAVLEKALREICIKNYPSISVFKSNGDFKTLDPLITDLKKAELYNELKAKQLREYADIRNHAAHGRFEEFTVEDVKGMIEGVNRFLSDYMGQ